MNSPSLAKQLLKLFCVIASMLLLHVPAQATTCNYTASWSVSSTASTSERIFTFSGDNRTLTVNAKPSATAYTMGVNLVIGFTTVSTPSPGDSCLFSLIRSGEVYTTALANTTTTFSRAVSGSGSSCNATYLGTPAVGSTYKTGAYLTSPVPGLVTDIYEFANCAAPTSFQQELVVTVSPGAVGSFTLDASKFVKVSAGQSNSNLNGSVTSSLPNNGQSLVTYSFAGYPTCSLSSPTVTLPTLAPAAVDNPSLNRGVDFSLDLTCKQGNVFAYTVIPVWAYTPASAGSSVIVNTGTATGVGVAITSKNVSPSVPVTNGYKADSGTIPANTSTSSLTFNYSAAYAKVGTTVSAGTVISRANITLSVQ
jgi:type 1 fimbria pilin